MFRKIIVLSCLLLVNSAFSKCVLKMDSYDGTLYDLLDNVYKCKELNRSFVLDIGVERQLPIRVSFDYSSKNYVSVLRGILQPLGLRLYNGKYSDVITKLQDEKEEKNFNSSSISSQIDSDSSSNRILTVVGDSVAWLTPNEAAELSIKDSLRRLYTDPVPVRLQFAFFSADTLRNHGIEEPEFLATITPKLDGFPSISLFSYGVKLHLYDDTLSDHQDLIFDVLDSASLTVGPRTRYSDATYSNGEITSTDTEDEQFGLSCTFRRSRDTISYSCSYARNSDTRDLVSFRNSMRVGATNILKYGLDQTVTSLGGGLFWFIPFLAESHAERRRYILAILVFTGSSAKD